MFALFPFCFVLIYWISFKISSVPFDSAENLQALRMDSLSIVCTLNARVLKLGSALLQVILLSMSHITRDPTKREFMQDPMAQRSMFGKKNLNLKIIVFTVRSSPNNYFASSFNLLFILMLIAGRSKDM